ncbi:hemerythrin domain-containing protein [uncultured Nevskia sp.]|uniref:hemerythrin domain-containing protein n=1 Tax=uncultured Nevskia sp. TaxID=228950 RepID=UPI0025E01967|nr:hemerythrin domain-containing protein [uncultured Nevskia sp.]
MTESIYDALRESHVRQRSLCRKLLLSKAHTEQRTELFTELRIELAAHAAAEERFLYVPILLDDMGLSSSRHALHEHHQIDELIEDMQVLDHSGRSWMASAKKLSEKVHHHLREEEKKFFQVSGKILNDAQKQRAAKQYRKDYLRMVKMLGEK